MEHVNFK